MARPQNDVGAYDALDKVEQRRRKQELQQALVLEVRGVELVPPLVPVLVPMFQEDPLQLDKLALVKDLVSVQQVPALVVRLQIIPAEGPVPG
jgi:hypothetical protein